MATAQHACMHACLQQQLVLQRVGIPTGSIQHFNSSNIYCCSSCKSTLLCMRRNKRIGSARHRDAAAPKRYVLQVVHCRTWWTSLNHTANCKPSQASAAVPQFVRVRVSGRLYEVHTGCVRVRLVVNAKYFAAYFLIVLLRQTRYFYPSPAVVESSNKASTRQSPNITNVQKGLKPTAVRTSNLSCGRCCCCCWWWLCSLSTQRQSPHTNYVLLRTRKVWELVPQNVPKITRYSVV